jgi:hypothetical protein
MGKFGCHWKKEVTQRTLSKAVLSCHNSCFLPDHCIRRYLIDVEQMYKELRETLRECRRKIGKDPCEVIVEYAMPCYTRVPFPRRLAIANLMLPYAATAFAEEEVVEL